MASPFGYVSNFCESKPLSLSQWFPVAEGVPKPVGVPKGRISVSTYIQADWKPGPQATMFNVCKYTSFRERHGDGHFCLLLLN